MPNRVCPVFVQLTVLSVLVITASAGGCSNGRGLRIVGTGGTTSPSEGTAGATGGSGGTTPGTTGTSGGATGTVGNAGGGGATTGGMVGDTGGATTIGTTGTGGISGTGDSKCITDRNTCVTDDDCTWNRYEPPLASPTDCYCFICGGPVAKAIQGDCQNAYSQFCGPNWQKDNDCPLVTCPALASSCVDGMCK